MPAAANSVFIHAPLSGVQTQTNRGVPRADLPLELIDIAN